MSMAIDRPSSDGQEVKTNAVVDHTGPEPLATTTAYQIMNLRRKISRQSLLLGAGGGSNSRIVPQRLINKISHTSLGSIQADEI